MTDDRISSTIAKTLVGFGAAGVVLAGLLLTVGADAVFRQFSAASKIGAAAVFAASFAWLFSWSTTLRAVLASLDRRPSHLSGVGLYSTAVFANNITPFGQAGGEPITAGTFSQVLDIKYERGLAAIASVDAVNLFPSVVFAVLGAAYTATQISFGRRLGAGVVTVVGLGLIAVVGGGAAWRNRHRLRNAVVPALTRIASLVAFVVPFVAAPTRDAVDARVTSFIASIEKISGSDGVIRVAVAGSTIGWTFQILGFWFAFHAIGTPIPVSVAMFAIPVSAIGSIAPLPGGTGGVEALMVGVVAAATTANPATAVAGVLLFRAAFYWFPIPLGAFSFGVMVTGNSKYRSD